MSVTADVKRHVIKLAREIMFNHLDEAELKTTRLDVVTAMHPVFNVPTLKWSLVATGVTDMTTPPIVGRAIAKHMKWTLGESKLQLKQGMTVIWFARPETTQPQEAEVKS